MQSTKSLQYNKLAGLDFLRAIAITLVFMYHYSLFEHPEWIEPYVSFGWTGVDLFFVLSGYLIAGQLFAKINQGKSISIKEFYFKRFFRIVPAYAFLLVLYFLVPAFREWGILPPLWKFLTFTQNIGLNRQLTGTFSHAWSLCIEEQFYLLLPVIIAITIYFKAGKKAFLLLPILFVAGFILRLLIWNKVVLPLEGTDNFFNTWMMWMYYPTFTRLDGLLVGVSAAAIFVFLPNIKNKLVKYGNLFLILGLVLIVLAGFICRDFISYQTSVYGFPLIAVAYGIIVIGAVSENSVLYKLKSGIVASVATLSYGLYLSHKGIIHLTQQLFTKLGVAEDSNLMLIICIVTCLMAAWVLHQLIEKPFLKWRDNYLANQ